MTSTDSTTFPDVETEATGQPTLPWGAATMAATASTTLTACGGGDDENHALATAERERAQAVASNTSATQQGAWRLLRQATMGPTDAEVRKVLQLGYAGWLNAQFDRAPDASSSHVARYNAHAGPLNYRYENGTVLPVEWDRFMSFTLWNKALQDQDQLRHRVVNALSQILVVSMRDDILVFRPYLVAGYLDMLTAGAFGSYKDLIRAVCTSPAMGYYLSHVANLPPIVGQRIPDQNFARELLQLFTIGLTRLNIDGTDQGTPTTTTEDIVVLSNVFTGWSLDNNPAYDVMNVMSGIQEPPGYVVVARDQMQYYDLPPATRRSPRYIHPMKGYSDWTNPGGGSYRTHSRAADVNAQLGRDAGAPIQLLGKTLAFDDNPSITLDNALKIIFEHPNVAPFIARQMIQRLVTSNPTTAYVKRVATAFQASDWSLRTLVSTILLDDEARSAGVAVGPTYGRLQEPFLRVIGLLRAFGVPDCHAGETNLLTSALPELNLNHAPMRAPSVFNDFSPSYQHPNGHMARAGKVTPEMQIAHEASVMAYINAMYRIVDKGLSQDERNPTPVGGIDFAAQFAGTEGNASAIVAMINRKLFGNSMSSELRTLLTSAASTPGASHIERVKSAVLMAVVSTEYMVQR